MKKPSSPIANWSLRNRLVIGVLVLSAIGITTVDFAAQTALKSYLIGQADDQLIAVADKRMYSNKKSYYENRNYSNAKEDS